MRLDIINKSGAWFSYQGERLGQGRDNVKNYLREHPDFADAVEKEVRANADKLGAPARKGKKTEAASSASSKEEPAAAPASAPAAKKKMPDIDIEVDDE